MNVLKYLCVCALLLCLSGCGWITGNDDMGSVPAPIDNYNSVNPDDNNTDNYQSTVDDYLNYLRINGMQLSNMNDVSDLGYDGINGKSFDYNGNTMYLLLADGTNTNMNSLLNDVRTNNSININRNGAQTMLPAIANGNYILVYENGTDLSGFNNVFSSYDFAQYNWPYTY